MKKRFMLIAVSFLILIFLFVQSDPKRVYEIFLKSDKNFLFYALIVSTFTALLRVLKWKVILNEASFHDVMPVQLLGITISNFTPGKIGEPTKSLLMKMKTGMPVSKSLTSIIWERILDVLVLVLLSLLFLRTFSSSLFLIEMTSIIVFAFIIMMSLLVIHRRDFGVRIFGLLKRLPLMNKISAEFINTFYREKIKWRYIALSFFITLLTWVLDGLVFYISFKSIGVEIDPTFFVGLFAVSTLIGVLSFLPGGLGSTEAVMVFLLSSKVDSAVAVTGVFAARILTFWYFVFLGFLSFIYLSKSMEIRKIFE